MVSLPDANGKFHHDHHDHHEQKSVESANPADSPVTHALDYAGRGFAVLPLHTPTGRGCSCGDGECASIGKHPRTEHGSKDAPTDPGQIREWWDRYPEANIGLRTGSGLAVLDTDRRHGGFESLAQLQSRHGPLPATAESITGD